MRRRHAIARSACVSWFGLALQEFSSGSNRVLGRISNRGDRYLRMLLAPGTRLMQRAAINASTGVEPTA